MNEIKVSLLPLKKQDYIQWERDLQNAFQTAVVKEFGEQQDFVISEEEIEECLHTMGVKAYHIIYDGIMVGGAALQIDAQTHCNSLELFFIRDEFQSYGIGLAAWQAIEARYPETKVWKTCTPYFEKRNIHFYVNKCGFHVTAFYHAQYPEPNMPQTDTDFDDGMFFFEKQMKQISGLR